MQECIFCKIVRGEIPCYKVYEDKRCLAILDIFPATEGQTLVIPKEHVTSRFSDVPDHVLADVLLTAKRVAAKLDSKLGTRTCLVIEGFDVDHLHYKLYPISPGEHARFMPGKKAEERELSKVASKITKLC